MILLHFLSLLFSLHVVHGCDHSPSIVVIPPLEKGMVIKTGFQYRVHVDGAYDHRDN